MQEQLFFNIQETEKCLFCGINLDFNEERFCSYHCKNLYKEFN